MIPLNIIVAVDQNNGIGKDGRLPWDLTADIQHFREVTSKARSPKKKNVVVMGRKTWESIPEQYRPLPERTNIVLTKNRTLKLPEGVLKAESFDRVLHMATNEQLKLTIETIFIIGGQRVYEQALEIPECERVYITHIHETYDCDAFFPSFTDTYESCNRSEEYTEDGTQYHFEEYTRKV